MIELEYYHFACPLPARLEGLNESLQEGGNLFIHDKWSLTSLRPSSSSIPGFWPSQTAFDLLIPLGLKQTKFPPGTPVWGGPVFFLTTSHLPTYPSPFPCCQLLTAIVTLCLSV